MKYSKNKVTLLNTAITMGVLLFVVLCFFGVGVIDVGYWLIALAVVEAFVIVPMFNIYFYKLYATNLEWKKYANFIPVYNYTISLSPICTITSLISFILAVFVIIGIFFPSTYVWALSENTIYGLSDKLPIVLFLLLAIFNCSIGVGLSGCVHSVNSYYTVGTNTSTGTTILAKVFRLIPWLHYVLLCLPLVRTVSLVLVLDKLTVLSNLNLNINNINIEEEV